MEREGAITKNHSGLQMKETSLPAKPVDTANTVVESHKNHCAHQCHLPWRKAQKVFQELKEIFQELKGHKKVFYDITK